MNDSSKLHQLFQETAGAFIAPDARVEDFASLPMDTHERGWSGAEIRRYEVQFSNASPARFILKTMSRTERRVLALLSVQGHDHIPYSHALDLDTDALVLTCMQDLGSRKLGRPGGIPLTSALRRFDPAVAGALAAIHLRNRGAVALSWLPRFDPNYVSQVFLPDFLYAYWHRTLEQNPAFAREFARYTGPVEQAAARFAATIKALWAEETSLTLTHGELHSEHILLHRGRPYFIDWATARYGPFYPDLAAYFTPDTVLHYREALAARGLEIPVPAFLERYHATRPYVGLKWLCTGIWQWGAGPTAETGRRLLSMLRWTIAGGWPEPAFLVPDVLWSPLLAAHLAGNDPAATAG